VYNLLKGDFLVQNQTPTISNSYAIVRENEKKIERNELTI
jgi:hypothetical protein